MRTGAKILNNVIRDIRLCFNHLRARADEMYIDLGVNASMRAVMESLDRDGEQTVPAIARGRGVSRQHIQVIVNGLINAELVKARDNPEDKRTVLVSLTDQGRAIFDEIQKREIVELQRLSRAFSADELTSTQDTLRRLVNALKGTTND
jgi:DNA-binding MarR family transcriptional regulator